MKKNLVLLIGVVSSFCACCSIDATQNISDTAVDFKSYIGCDCEFIEKNQQRQQTTYNIYYQYTTDGYLQHVADYGDGVICTNIEGPREGVQFIVMNNGALFDMCHTNKKYKKYFVNTYQWGEVITYSDHQTVTIK